MTSTAKSILKNKEEAMKYRTIAALIALSLLAACSKEADINVDTATPADEIVTLTTTVGVPGEPPTRAL